MVNGFSAFNSFSYNLTHASFQAGRFGDALLHGNWILNGFFDGISTLGSSVLEYTNAAFKEATGLEIERIAAGGAISSGFDNKIDFGGGLESYDKIRTSLAGIAAELPGVTSEYTRAFTLLSDDIAGALNNGKRSATELTKAFETKAPEIIKNLVLNSKLYGQDIPISAVTRSFTKLLDTGKVTNKEIFFQRNPLLKASIEKYEKKNGKLSGMAKDTRLDALNEIFSSTFSKAQLDMLQNAFGTRIEALRSALVDPDVGLFGFNRKIKSNDGESTTFFGILSKAAAPFIVALTDAAALLTQFADPMQALGNLVETFVTPRIKEFSLGIARAFDQGINFNGTIAEKIRFGILQAFDFDINKVDVAAEITKFFDLIVNTINSFGKNGQFTSNPKIDAAIAAMVDGIIRIIDAVTKRLGEQFIADPVGFTKMAFIFNPSAVIQFGIFIAAVIPAIISLGSVLWSVGSFLLTAGLAILGFLTTTVVGVVLLIVGIFVGVLAVIVVWREQLAVLGHNLSGFSGFMQTTVRLLGSVFSDLGQAGKSLKEAWDKLMSGDWQGALMSLLEGLMFVLSATFKGIALVFVAIGDLLFSSIKAGLEAIGGAIYQFTSGMVNTLSKWVTDGTAAITSFATGLYNGMSKWINDFGKWLVTPLDLGPAFQSFVENLAKIPDMFKQAVIDPIANLFPQLLSQLPGGKGTAAIGSAYAGIAGSSLGTAVGGPIGTIVNGYNAIKGIAGNIFGGNAAGNPLGDMVAGFLSERRAAPSGSSVVFANSSEAIIPRDRLGGLASAGTGGNNISMTIINNTGDDIVEKVRFALEQILG